MSRIIFPNGKLAVLLVILFTFGINYSVKAQQQEKSSGAFFKKNLDYQLRAFYNIGGSVPLHFPAQIREVIRYDPGLQLGLEVNATKWLSDEHKWGVRAGLNLESRGMTTKARTKNYLTEVIQNEAKIKGYYTGMVETNMENSYLTLPLSAVYKVGSKWNLYAGLYASYLLKGNFSGYVSDGYLREGTPVGRKIVFNGDSKAAYDFSEELNRFQWGTHIGAEYAVKNHFKLFGTLNYGFNSLLDPDFKAISFKLHNLFLDLGFAYHF